MSLLKSTHLGKQMYPLGLAPRDTFVRKLRADFHFPFLSSISNLEYCFVNCTSISSHFNFAHVHACKMRMRCLCTRYFGLDLALFVYPLLWPRSPAHPRPRSSSLIIAVAIPHGAVCSSSCWHFPKLSVHIYLLDAVFPHPPNKCEVIPYTALLLC